MERNEQRSTDQSLQQVIRITAEIVSGHALNSMELAVIEARVCERIEGVRDRLAGALHQAVERQKVTPPQLARMWGVSPDKVLAWIRTGELKAVDTSTKRGGRPRYSIDVEAIEAFEQRRSVAPPIQRPPRHRKADEGVMQFF